MYPRVGDATRTYFSKVLGEALDVLREHDIDYLLIGSLAKACQLDDDWDPASDVDLLVTKEGADKALDVFGHFGFATHVREPTWIYKVAKPNVTIDLIFWSAGSIELTDEMLKRSSCERFEGVDVRVPCVEDMALLYVMLDSEERQGYWYDAMRYFRSVTDWEYLVQRGRGLSPAKLLSALLYARETGLRVPGFAVDSLLSA
jgi:hypothetical protein